MKLFWKESSILIFMVFFFIASTTFIPDDSGVEDWIDRFNVGMLSSFLLFGASVLALEEIKNRWTNRRRRKTNSA